MRLKGSPDLTHAIAAGSSLGLAILTKATAYPYAAPFLAWSCVSGLRTFRWKYLKPALVIAIVVVSVNHGHYRRLLDLHGSPFGPGQNDSSGEYTYTNDLFTIPAFASNVVRNLALQAASPSERFNRVIERGVRLFHTAVGMDINDPRTTLAGSEFRVARLSTHEDFAANPLHLSLAALATALLLTGRGLRRQRYAIIYLTLVICGFLLFSLFLRWQPWQNRLQLPLLVLFSPLIAITLGGIQSQAIANSVALALVLCSLPWVFQNVSRPLAGQTSIFTANRTDQYFANRPDLKDPYERAARYVRSRGCQDIGLILGRDDWEYPLWVLLRSTGNRGVRLEHIGVKNLSAVKSKVLPVFDPCAVIALQGGLIDVFFRR